MHRYISLVHNWFYSQTKHLCILLPAPFWHHICINFLQRCRLWNFLVLFGSNLHDIIIVSQRFLVMRYQNCLTLKKSWFMLEYVFLFILHYIYIIRYVNRCFYEFKSLISPLFFILFRKKCPKLLTIFLIV